VRGLSGALARLFFPQWIRRYGPEHVLFQPVSVSLAAWLHGMMASRPWSIAGGRATRAAVESEVARAARLSEGVPASKLVVTGKPSDDLTYKAIARDVGLPRQVTDVLSDGRPLLVLAVPQLAEHRILPWDEHWAEIEFLFRTLERAWKGPVLASLHPKSDPDQYRAFASKHGVQIAEDRLQRILPSCDVFVATYSSTVVQAIALAKPTVVVDFYGLDYTFYDNAPGVVVTRDRQQLEPVLGRIQTDPAYRRQLSQRQESTGKDWCLLDGRSTARILDVLEKLISAHQPEFRRARHRHAVGHEVSRGAS